MREIIFQPAFDLRETRQGVHGVDMLWFLRKKKGVLQFVTHTNWMLPHVATEIASKASADCSSLPPLPASIDLHSYAPQHKGQALFMEECPILKAPCYFDGSAVLAQRVFNILVEKGSEAVWNELECIYQEWTK